LRHACHTLCKVENGILVTASLHAKGRGMTWKKDLLRRAEP